MGSLVSQIVANPYLEEVESRALITFIGSDIHISVVEDANDDNVSKGELRGV